MDRIYRHQLSVDGLFSFNFEIIHQNHHGYSPVIAGFALCVFEGDVARDLSPLGLWLPRGCVLEWRPRRIEECVSVKDRVLKNSTVGVVPCSAETVIER